MQLSNIFTDDDAVSPVIGVILMVAITVILAAVIGAFVLNLGGGQESPPQVDWGWSDNSSSASSGGVTLEHNGGDRVDNPDQITMTGDLSSDITLDNSDLFDADTVSAGDDAVLTNSTSTSLSSGTGTLELVWESSDGSNSQVIDGHDYDTTEG